MGAMPTVGRPIVYAAALSLSVALAAAPAAHAGAAKSHGAKAPAPHAGPAPAARSPGKDGPPAEGGAHAKAPAAPPAEQAQSGGASASRSSSGELSTVTLIDVSRVPAAVLDMVQPGAEDGLVFLFLVVRQPSARGTPTMHELRDFQIDRRSYRERTEKALGAPIEPVSFVEDVNDFLARVSPGPAPDALVPDGEAFVVVTTIGGAKLPAEGRGEVRIDVGWGGKTESLPFSFALPRAGSGEDDELPATPGEPAPEGRGPILSL